MAHDHLPAPEVTSFGRPYGPGWEVELPDGHYLLWAPNAADRNDWAAGWDAKPVEGQLRAYFSGWRTGATAAEALDVMPDSEEGAMAKAMLLAASEAHGE